jgi:hypothetical protein
LCVLVLSASSGPERHGRTAVASTDSNPPGKTQMTTADEQFLDELERRSFLYFWEQTNSNNGMVPDRARADGSGGRNVASTAGIGFGLSALCVGVFRGWITHEQAYDRALLTLKTLRETVPTTHGFYYHFLDLDSGQRAWKSEVSSIDTALLMAGVLMVRQQFAHTEIETLATHLWNAVEWPWMLNNGATFSLSWTPEHEFAPYRWDNFSEHPLLDLMAMGSAPHPAPPEVWHAWQRGPVTTYAGRTFMQCPPLFTHQYPWAWIDVRNMRDDYADYFLNSSMATLAQRQMCIDLATRFPSFGPNMWGLTASDAPDGYRAWGGPDPTPDLDGTIVPAAIAGSLPFAPRECLEALRHIHDNFGASVFRRYGFVDAFNPGTKWVDKDVVAIDVGISLLMAENVRTNFVPQTFMRNVEIRRGLELARFRQKTPEDVTASPMTSLYRAITKIGKEANGLTPLVAESPAPKQP